MKNESEKTKISCSICEEAVIAGTVAGNPAIREHLAGCPVCRSFAEFQKEALALEPVIEDRIPEFADIKRLAGQRKKSYRNMLRLVVIPVSMAAAVALCIGTVLFDVQLETTGRNQPLTAQTATEAVQNLNAAAAPEVELVNAWLEEGDLFAVSLEENTVTLAWDQTGSSALAYKKSLQALRSNEQWNIEVANSYNEDILW